MKTTTAIIIGSIVLTFGIFCGTRGDYYSIFACLALSIGGWVMGFDYRESLANKRDKKVKEQKQDWMFPTQGELCEEYYDPRN